MGSLNVLQAVAEASERLSRRGSKSRQVNAMRCSSCEKLKARLDDAEDYCNGLIVHQEKMFQAQNEEARNLDPAIALAKERVNLARNAYLAHKSSPH